MIGALLVLGLAGSAAGFGLRGYMDRAAENRLRAGEDVAVAKLRGPLPDNAYLACPPGYCATAAAPSPLFAIPVGRLRQAYERLISGEPRVVVLVEQPDRIVVIQRSPVFAFPDIVTAELVGLGPERSSLALYSRARYGRYDFGVNRRRVAAWLAELSKLARE